MYENVGSMGSMNEAEVLDGSVAKSIASEGVGEKWKKVDRKCSQ